MTTANTTLSTRPGYDGAPAWSEFRLADEAAVREAAAEIDGFAPGPDYTVWARDNIDAQRRDAAAALALFSAPDDTRNVWLARDDRGFWFTTALKDEYRDATLRVEDDSDYGVDERGNDVRAPSRRLFLDALDCDCGASVILAETEAPAMDTEQARIHPSGEMHVRCMNCGVVYVLSLAETERA